MLPHHDPPAGNPCSRVNPKTEPSLAKGRESRPMEEEDKRGEGETAQEEGTKRPSNYLGIRAGCKTAARILYRLEEVILCRERLAREITGCVVFTGLPCLPSQAARPV